LRDEWDIHIVLLRGKSVLCRAELGEAPPSYSTVRRQDAARAMTHNNGGAKLAHRIVRNRKICIAHNYPKAEKMHHTLRLDPG
jgi:hypothetical protein